MLHRRGHSIAEALTCLDRMMGSIKHRGPDGSGAWHDASSGVYLGHVRLAILDLSEGGKQPMVSASGRYIISFNGEIYNYRELRGAMEKAGVAFRGGSDTEVLLQAIETIGLRVTLSRCIGMFAVAIWDKIEATLSLFVDRMGEKPLYYGWAGDALLFGSELSLFQAHPGWRNDVDERAFQLYLRHGYVPAPFSICKGVQKVMPGEVVSVRLIREKESASVDRHRYWAPQPFTKAEELVSGRSDSEEIADLEALLKTAVRDQMVADVPVGAFLSGGVDSSLVVALMQAQSGRAVKTFTIGLEDTAMSEAGFARAVAAHLGTDHTELIVTSKDALDLVPKIPHIFDEPFADSSQIPTYLVSKLARREVTVSLSGDGGDELFGGYRTYAHTQRVWSSISRAPKPLRRLLGRSLGIVPNRMWRSLEGLCGRGVPKLASRISHLRGILGAGSIAETHYRMVSAPSSPVRDEYVTPLAELAHARTHSARSVLSLLTLMDMISYLPGDILVKVDRAAMAVSLETRVPLLDQRIVERALRMRDDLKIRSGVTKWALRQILYKYVPPKMIERPKRGFSIPIADWLRGPLHDWAHELLRHADYECYGSLSRRTVQKMWADHASGRSDESRLLWSLLMFQQWKNARR